MPKTMTVGLLGLPGRRRAAGYTQEGLSAALGVTRVALAQWETGRAWPSAALLPQMADLLLCSIDDLYAEPSDELQRTEDKVVELRAHDLHGPEEEK